jgi:hypothetical protein
VLCGRSSGFTLRRVLIGGQCGRWTAGARREFDDYFDAGGVSLEDT